MKHVGSASTTRKPVAHLLSCVRRALRHTRARAPRARARRAPKLAAKSQKRTGGLWNMPDTAGYVAPPPRRAAAAARVRHDF
eukprot:scaffold65536_cov36-Phaeocystis_antarctica.AAC.1